MHQGVDLNERADVLAGAAVTAEDGEEDKCFEPPPAKAGFTYRWTPEGAEESTSEQDHKKVFKQWDVGQLQLTKLLVQEQGTFAGQLLTKTG